MIKSPAERMAAEIERLVPPAQLEIALNNPGPFDFAAYPPLSRTAGVYANPGTVTEAIKLLRAKYELVPAVEFSNNDER